VNLVTGLIPAFALACLWLAYIWPGQPPAILCFDLAANLAVGLASTLHLILHLLCIYLAFDLAFREKGPFWPFLADLPGFRPKMQGWQQG
jgi:hypothetical protein